MKLKSILLVAMLLPAVTSAAEEGIPHEYSDGVACKSCHEEQYREWQGSHHDLAMAAASPESVLGDFDNGEFGHFAVTSRFFMDEGRYMVHTDGPDGSLQDFQIKYTFGTHPLQQ